MEFQSVHFYDSLARENFQKGEINRALEIYREAIVKFPEHPELYNNFANVHSSSGKHHTSYWLYKKAISLNQNFLAALHNQSQLYFKYGFYRKAKNLYENILQNSQNDPETLTNLGICHYQLRDYVTAQCCFEKAVELNPDFPSAHFNLACVLLIQEIWEQGWREYQWRFKLASAQSTLPKLKMSEWKGEPLQGKHLLILGEQGFGDAIQFSRYIFPLIKIASSPRVCEKSGLTLLVPKQLFTFFQFNFPNISIKMQEEFEMIQNADYWIPLLSLPTMLAPNPQKLSIGYPYLRPDESRMENFHNVKKDRNLKIGIAWKGNKLHLHDHQRSIADKYLKQFKFPKNSSIYSLHVDVEDAYLNSQFNRKIINLGKQFRDFSDTSAAIESLDLVLTVDTSIAHLSGSLGKKTYLLLPFSSDWRWGISRKTDLWYPSISIFRQPMQKDWTSLIKEICEKLKSF